ncbi:MAG: peptidoglycan editing factor PgeF [Pseudohongiellaceae bacterium]
MSASLKDVVVAANWEASERVVAFTTTRQGGVSQLGYDSFNQATHVGDEAKAVSENRRRLQQLVGGTPDFQWLDQVHGVDVHRARNVIEPPRADALVTDQVNLACCVLTADCLPVFFASKEGDEVAIAHAGWRGLAAGIIESTIAKMRTPAKNLIAYLGPAIGPCHFEVGSDVVDAFGYKPATSVFSRCFSPVFGTGNTAKYLANLPELAALKLEQLDVSVTRSQLCTVCEEGSLYSFRRTPVTGRMANVIYIRS